MTRTTTATPDEPQDPDGRGPTSRIASEPRSRKRANGEGTIYQRKDGRYERAAFVPTTAGTSKRVRVYGHTQEDVRRQLTRLLEQADRGIPVAAESWTVAKYLAYWTGACGPARAEAPDLPGVRGSGPPLPGPRAGQQTAGQADRPGRTGIHYPDTGSVPVLQARRRRRPRRATVLRPARRRMLRVPDLGAHGPVHPCGTEERA